MPFTLRNLKADLEDVGSNFDGAPDLEFRLATDALELEKSGLSFQSVPPTNRSVADVAPPTKAQPSRRSDFGHMIGHMRKSYPPVGPLFLVLASPESAEAAETRSKMAEVAHRLASDRAHQRGLGQVLL